jgi:hypothetical protein
LYNGWKTIPADPSGAGRRGWPSYVIATFVWNRLELSMAAAALTPRIRLMAICDGVRESNTEPEVFNVKGLRQRIVAQGFPFVPARLWLFLVFSSPRAGVFPGYVLVVDDETDKTVFYCPLSPAPRCEANDETMFGRAPLRCSFPHGGRYTVQFWFFQEQGNDVLKGEISFFVDQDGG